MSLDAPRKQKVPYTYGGMFPYSAHSTTKIHWLVRLSTSKDTSLKTHSSSSSSSLSSTVEPIEYSSATFSVPSITSLHVSLALRQYEHLAVLLPRELWKPDVQATQCDSIFYRAQFTLLDRRRHCRKCGGVFCAMCSSRATPLLDTTALPFLHPPKNMPLAVYASKDASLLPHRICDPCFNQIHGIFKPLPTSPAVTSTPSEDDTAGRFHVLPRRTATAQDMSPQLPVGFGELATYPLCCPSAVCKAVGGGRWVPSPDPIDPSIRRVPGRKAPYEIALEEEERAARNEWESPLITDGEFRMRRPVDWRRRSLAVPG